MLVTGTKKLKFISCWAAFETTGEEEGRDRCVDAEKRPEELGGSTEDVFCEGKTEGRKRS